MVDDRALEPAILQDQGHYLMVAALIAFAVFVAVGLAARIRLADIVMIGISQSST